mmetsp:Transcript_5418/g.12436  ORF Transcript_5418/g.12436 Transcript_5418/m.12436 type:complete len:222 (-) Transcript_5418:1220-1885(-)
MLSLYGIATAITDEFEDDATHGEHTNQVEVHEDFQRHLQVFTELQGRLQPSSRPLTQVVVGTRLHRSEHVQHPLRPIGCLVIRGQRSVAIEAAAIHAGPTPTQGIAVAPLAALVAIVDGILLNQRVVRIHRVLVLRWHAQSSTFAGALLTQIHRPGLVLCILEELDPFQMAPGDRAFGHVAPHRHVSAIRIPVATTVTFATTGAPEVLIQSFHLLSGVQLN